MITIRNKKTGEVKQIEETQLGDFGLTPSVKSNLMMPTTETPAQVQTTQPKTPKITFDQIYKMSLDPNVKTSTYNKFKALYDLQKEEEKANKKEVLGTEAQKTEGLVKSGVRALEVVREEYQKDPSLVLKQKIPGKYFSRKFDAALFNSVDTLLRLRTGATAPPSEVRNYMRSFGPVFGDRPEDVQFKLNQLQADLLDAGGKAEEFKKISITPAEGKKTSPIGQIGEVLFPNVTKSVDIIKNTPQIISKSIEEIKQKGPLGKPSPELRKLMGGTGEVTGNTLIDTFNDARKMTNTQVGAGAELATVLSSVKGVKNLFSGGVKNPVTKASEQRILEAATKDAEGVVLKNKEIIQKTLEKINGAKNLGAKDKKKATEFLLENFKKKGGRGIQESVGDFMNADAFTKGGTKIKGPKGLYNYSLRETYKELWQKQAPGVLENTEKMRKWFGFVKSAKGTAGLLGATAGGIAGATYLFNLFSGKGGGYSGGGE